MENQKVHEYTVSTGPNGLPAAQLGKVNHLVTFIQGGLGKIHNLNGRWVNDGNIPIDESLIPEHIKQQFEAIPFDGRVDRTPDVFVNCEFCAYSGPSREYAKHTSGMMRLRRQSHWS
jgi:hypothetical protein